MLLQPSRSKTLNASALAQRLHEVLLEELRVRAEFEKAKLLEDEDRLLWSFFDAGVCGRTAYRDRVPYANTPALLASQPLLKNGWQQGWKGEQIDEEIERCPHCTYSDEPCPEHD